MKRAQKFIVFSFKFQVGLVLLLVLEPMKPLSRREAFSGSSTSTALRAEYEYEYEAKPA